MRKLALVLTLCSSLPSYVLSQNLLVKGTVADTSEKKVLTNTVITIIRKSDSLMLGFTRSDNAGNFMLKQIAAGKSVLIVIHPAYADYVDEMDISGISPIDLGKIFLTRKSQLLQEVIVSNGAAIRIKGDTTEFKADSFHMKLGSTIEDLLKKLPGIQVDKNGKITAQGQAVQKVLIDGEEFFSDDPTIVTQNMLSDAVDKVQVYDKKSDQATFTGVDDGVKQKTIDLKLKENKKRGYFGKIEAGADANKYWNNIAMFNAFKKKRKFSVFGIMSNTGRTGLNWIEGDKYGTSTYDSYADGGTSTNLGGDDLSSFDGTYGGEGLPKAWNAGALYSNNWDNNKISLNTSYQYRKINSEARGLTQSKYIMPDTLYYINEKGDSYTSKLRHSLNGTYDYQLDSLSSLKLTVSGYAGKSIGITNFHTESLDEFAKFVNTSNRRISTDADTKNLNTALLYRKKFGKPGRTILVTGNLDYNDTQSDGFLNAHYKFYDGLGNEKKEEITDQQKVRDNIRSGVSGRAVYTEPLSKRAILEFNYSLANTNSRSGITTLGKIPGSGPKYEDVIDSLSNDYSLNVLTNSAGINYRYAKPKKISLSFGAIFSKADFTREDKKTNTSVAYGFTNFFPRVGISYTLPNSANLNFSYNGYARAPSIDQIQPIRDNTDLLYQRIGNPDLKQSFRQSIDFSYSSYKPLSQSSFYSNLNASTVLNEFSTINYIDQLGRRISQPVNVNGNRSLGLYGSFSKKLNKPDMRTGISGNVSINRNTGFINSLKNINNSLYATVGPTISISKEKKYDITLRPQINYTKTTSSIRPDEPTRYFTQEHSVYVYVALPLKFEFNTDCTFSIRQKTDVFDRNTNATRWNASVQRKIFKKEATTLRLAVYDILDQNIGFRRSVNSNFISERTYDTFRRYLMLSVIWNFNKNDTQ